MSLSLKVKIKVDTKAIKRIERILRDLDDSAEIGFFDGHIHPKDNGKNTIAEVAMINELGIGVPQRRFFRETLEEHNNYLKHLETASRLIITGKMKKKVALNDIGAAVEEDVKGKIADNSFKQNDKKTVAKKGFDDPLTETGTMERDVSHRVK